MEVTWSYKFSRIETLPTLEAVKKDKKEVQHHLIPGTYLSCDTDYTEVLADHLNAGLKRSQAVTPHPDVSNDGYHTRL